MKNKHSWDGYRPFTNHEQTILEQRLRASLKENLTEAPPLPVRAPAIRKSSDSSQVRPLDFSNFMQRDVKPRADLLGGWLHEKAPVLISGAPGIGKSFFIHSIAVALASQGEAFGWKAPQASTVGILDGEMHDDTIQRRLAAIVKGQNREFDPSMFQLATADMYAESEETTPNLRDAAQRKRVLEIFSDVDVLIVDNINCLFVGGNERETNFWYDPERFIFECRQREIAPILIHHTTKSSPNSPAGSSKNLRVVEVSVVLSKVPSGPDEGSAHFNVVFQKTREMGGSTTARSARAVTDEAAGALTWEMGPFVGEDDVASNWLPKARELLEQGKSYSEIAKTTNKSKSTVHRYLTGEQRSFVP